MNMRRLSASIFPILGAALLFACGMPPIPPPQSGTQALPAGRTPFGTQAGNSSLIQADPEEIEPDRTATAAAFAATGTQVALQAGTQAAEASQVAHQATRQALEVEQAVAQAATAAAQAKPPLELSEAGEGVGEPDFSGPGDESPQPEAGREPSTGVQPDPGGLVDCAETGPGREKVRVVNKTGEGAMLYLFGLEDYACDIPAGVQRIYIRGGVYNLSSRMCGGQLYDLGSNVINPTWYITLRCP